MAGYGASRFYFEPHHSNRPAPCKQDVAHFFMLIVSSEIKTLPVVVILNNKHHILIYSLIYIP